MLNIYKEIHHWPTLINNIEYISYKYWKQKFVHSEIDHFYIFMNYGFIFHFLKKYIGIIKCYNI